MSHFFSFCTHSPNTNTGTTGASITLAIQYPQSSNYSILRVYRSDVVIPGTVIPRTAYSSASATV